MSREEADCSAEGICKATRDGGEEHHFQFQSCVLEKLFHHYQLILINVIIRAL